MLLRRPPALLSALAVLLLSFVVIGIQTHAAASDSSFIRGQQQQQQQQQQGASENKHDAADYDADDGVPNKLRQHHRGQKQQRYLSSGASSSGTGSKIKMSVSGGSNSTSSAASSKSAKSAGSSKSSRSSKSKSESKFTTTLSPSPSLSPSMSLQPSNEPVPAVIATGYDETFRILDCSATTVVAEGEVAESLQVGHLIVSTGTTGDDVCLDCAPLYRKIVSISDGSSAGAKLFTTEFATFSDIFGLFVEDISDKAVELPFRCSHTSSTNARRLETSSHARRLQVSSCASDWQTKDSDGNCFWTNCNVGKDGDPVDCFHCKDQCDNGCGEKGSIANFDGNVFGLFDFGPACCNHDFCYSAYDSFSQFDCDLAFYKNMLDACPLEQGNIIQVLLPLLPQAQRFVNCVVVATLFFFFVDRFGEDARMREVADQSKYEEKDECAEKCEPREVPIAECERVGSDCTDFFRPCWIPAGCTIVPNPNPDGEPCKFVATCKPPPCIYNDRCECVPGSVVSP